MFGEVPKWPKGTGCKPAGSAFEGSNPSLSTINMLFRTEDGNGRHIWDLDVTASDLMNF
jgi:hypothetical protein